MTQPRFIIGIDLGTTNSAVAFVDTHSAEQQVAIFEVPQLCAPAALEPRRQLPSFLYLAGEHDLADAETALPWNPKARTVVGELARSQGARMPARMVSSAKSWLCHGGVDRKAAILPWGIEGDAKLSPIAASAQVLGHIRDAWDHQFARSAGAAFIDQEIIITVPASFDEAARELTLEAARTAFGLTDSTRAVLLIEEPQAAFYAWIDTHPSSSRANLLAAGDRVLVFDIGGGTTDFTLIDVDTDGETFSRTAVGDHLLLGGDNIDLTLAKRVEQRLVERAGKKLDVLQWHGLVHACRMAKETLLGDQSLVEAPVNLGGRGSKLIGGSLKDKVSQSELLATVDDGFFPIVDRGATPQRSRGGLQEFGLPYAADPAITRHLATFLERHQVARVDAVLFNGGAMTPAHLRSRILDQVARWQEGVTPRELSNELPELAVAHGAAYYGLVRRGQGARIRGGTPRAFYVGVEGPDRERVAVCLAASGLEEGSRVELAQDYSLVTNRPVSFKLYSSSSRNDQPGAVVPVGDGVAETLDDGSDLLELPPIVTVLRAPGRGQVTVRLEVAITELGALEIWCTDQAPVADGSAAQRWRLSFDMRAGGAAAAADDDAKTTTAAEDDPRLGAAKDLLVAAFVDGKDLPRLTKQLETLFDARRDDWSSTVNRGLFDALIALEETRKTSADHEQRWLNLAGFCLRPGFGAPLDQWRAKQMWRIFNEGLANPKSEACRLGWWIVWRRIAGGLTSGQQEQFWDRLSQLFLPGAKQKKKWHEAKATKEEAAEMVRTLANLERLEPQSKIKLGDEMMRRLETKKGREDQLNIWAIGRIGARVPLYGPLNAVVPASCAAGWLETLLAMEWPDPEKAAFPLAQLGRRTGDRARDIGDALRERLATQLRTMPGGDRMARLVEEVIALEAREERVALGDTLPAGLRLVLDDDAT